MNENETREKAPVEVPAEAPAPLQTLSDDDLAAFAGAGEIPWQPVHWYPCC